MFQSYTLDILANVSFFLSLIYAINLSSQDTLYNDSKSSALMLCVFTALMLGLFDIGYGWSGDRELYAYSFNQMKVKEWSEILFKGEWLFNSYMKVASFLGKPQNWLSLTAFIYTFNYYNGAKRITIQNVYLLMLVIISAFCFSGYGTNTIRAGLALSFVFLGLTYIEEKWKWMIYFFIAFNIHHSTAIPMAAALVAKYYPRPKLFYYFWFFCVILSAVAGGYFITLFADLGSDFDDRVDYLTTTETHYNVGFRIDFILYSCLPILAGHYYQNKLGYKDSFYAIIHNTYIISNAFWVLVIRANFSDRFSYLSWFLYALVMIYPFVKSPLYFGELCNSYLVKIIMVISLFSYFMYWKY